MPTSLSLTPPVLNVLIGPLVVYIQRRCHPEVDCPFDFDWLVTRSTLKSVPLAEKHYRRSVEAEDLATFRTQLQRLETGAHSAALHPCEGPFGVEVLRTEGDNFHVAVIDETGTTGETIASIHDVREWIAGLDVILQMYPCRSMLAGGDADTKSIN